MLVMRAHWFAVAALGLAGCASASDSSVFDDSSTISVTTTPVQQTPSSTTTIATTPPSLPATTISAVRPSSSVDESTSVAPVAIEFAAGTSSAEVPVDADVPSVFSIRASAAQEMSFRLRPAGQDGPPWPGLDAIAPTHVAASIILADTQGHVLAEGATYGTRWLPSDGTYTLTVHPDDTNDGGVPMMLDVGIVDHFEPCQDCAPPAWTTRANESVVTGTDVSTRLPDFDDPQLDDAQDSVVMALLERYAQPDAGYLVITSNVLLAATSLVVIEYYVQFWDGGTPAPTDFYAALMVEPGLGTQHVGDGSMSQPFDATAALTIVEPSGAWAAQRAADIDGHVRQAMADQLSLLRGPDGTLDASLGDFDTTGGLVAPALDGVAVSWPDCELLNCALGATRIVLPYEAIPGASTALLTTALAGPVAAGD